MVMIMNVMIGGFRERSTAGGLGSCGYVLSGEWQGGRGSLSYAAEQSTLLFSAVEAWIYSGDGRLDLLSGRTGVVGEG